MQLRLTPLGDALRLRQQVKAALPLGHGGGMQRQLQRDHAVGQGLVPGDALQGLCDTGLESAERKQA